MVERLQGSRWRGSCWIILSLVLPWVAGGPDAYPVCIPLLALVRAETHSIELTAFPKKIDADYKTVAFQASIAPALRVLLIMLKQKKISVFEATFS